MLYGHLQMPRYKTDVLLRIEKDESPNLSSMMLRHAALPDDKKAAMYSVLLHSRYVLTPVISALD